MIVVPAIDIRRGRVVRLVQGRAQDETVYGREPAEVARLLGVHRSTLYRATERIDVDTH